MSLSMNDLFYLNKMLIFFSIKCFFNRRVKCLMNDIKMNFTAWTRRKYAIYFGKRFRLQQESQFKQIWMPLWLSGGFFLYSWSQGLIYTRKGSIPNLCFLILPSILHASDMGPSEVLYCLPEMLFDSLNSVGPWCRSSFSSVVLYVKPYQSYFGNSSSLSPKEKYFWIPW